MKKLISLFIVFATFLGVTLGKTVYVNANHPANGNGTSWSSPYTNLQTAVTAAAAGDLVLVTNGVYLPITTGNKAMTIQSVDGSAVTSIDGRGTTRCATLGTGVVLKGFTLFNGYTTGNGGGSNSGTLTGCTISGNTANNGGGSYSGTLTGCTISGNTANQYGGGSYNSTLTGCTISGNTANRYGGGSAGAALTDCTISGNTADGGGGTYQSVVYNSAIYNNTATERSGVLERGQYYNCTIYGNTAPDYAVGNANGHSSEPSIYNCVIYGNVNTGPNTRQLQVPLGGIFYCSSIDSVDKLYYGVNTPTVFPVYGDPQFTDPLNDDFTLLPTSPCINKGANQYVTTATDLLGSPRIKDWRVDMGAYEAQSTRFVTTPNSLFPMGTKDVGKIIPAIAWYKLDGNALDSSGNGYHGMWAGTESYTNGHSTGVVAGHFDGLSSIALGYISITNSCVTIMAWIKPSAIAKDFLTFRTSLYRYAGTSAIRIYLGGGGYGYNVTGFNLPLNEYNHVAISLHPEEGAIGYQNGKIVGTSAETQSIAITLSFIAKSNWSTYSGGLSDIRIYNCVLSEANIARIMSSVDKAPLEELQ